MSLVMSDQRPGMSAALTTPFMQTDGMCSEIWVKFLGSGDAKIEAVLYTEDLVDESLTVVMSSYKNIDSFLFSELYIFQYSFVSSYFANTM